MEGKVSREDFWYSKLVLLQPKILFSFPPFFLRLLSHAILPCLFPLYSRPNSGGRDVFCSLHQTQTHERTPAKEEDEPELEYTVAPPKAPSKIRMGVRTKRGPISIRDVCGGPLGCNGSFSIILWRQVRKPENILLRGYGYLEVAKPNLIVKNGKTEDVVDEWFGLSCLRGHTEDLARASVLKSLSKCEWKENTHVWTSLSSIFPTQSLQTICRSWECPCYPSSNCRSFWVRPSCVHSEPAF